MRFTLIAGSFGALILLLVFGFLLFKSPKENVVDIPTSEREVPAEASVSQNETTVSTNQDVSHGVTPNERPLGNDINMEFPTLEE